jgi:HPt (histidine-containing phosphotransfer) domain-containing protein
MVLAQQRFGAHTYDMQATLDQAYLSENTLGDEALRNEVLRLFLKQSGFLIEQLEIADQSVSIAEYAHTLKGSALAVGAFQVAGAAEKLEKLAEQGQVDLKDAFANVKSKLAEARVLIAPMIA